MSSLMLTPAINNERVGLYRYVCDRDYHVKIRLDHRVIVYPPVLSVLKQIIM